MPSPVFKLRIFESEFREIEDLVLKYPNIETGGDLFGLWTRDAHPVVQLLIGPGKKCRRTSVSFHQDTDYLENVGTYLNTSFMLCHIGSWHSHHQLSLTHPSAGDRSTVCNNFPRGLPRYIMIIANIECSTRSGAKFVVIHPYMFTHEGHICDEGSVQVIPSASPFREDLRVQSVIAKAMEVNHSVLDHALHVSHPSTKSPLLHEHRYGTEEWDVQKPSKASDQWYSSATGQAKLIEIMEGIKALNRNENQASNKPEFTRNQHSCDFSLGFIHNGCKWFIEFPKSFDKDHAKIFFPSEIYLSPSSDGFILSNDVVQSVLNFCGCESCRAAKRNRKIVRRKSECEMTVARSRDKMQEPTLEPSEEESHNELPKAKENESCVKEDSYHDEIMKPSTPERLNSNVLRSLGRSKSPRSNKHRHSPYHTHKRVTRDICMESDHETDQKLEAVACSSVLHNESLGKRVTSPSPKNEPRRAAESDTDASENNQDQITNVSDVGDRERLSSSSKSDTLDSKLRIVRSNEATEHHNQELTRTSYDSEFAERFPYPDETGILRDQRLLGTLESNDTTECGLNQGFTCMSYDGDRYQLGRIDINDTAASGSSIQEQTSTSYDGDCDQSFSSESSTTFESFIESCNQERFAYASGPSLEQSRSSRRESSCTATRDTAAPKEVQQWYESAQGEERLKTINQQLLSDLKVPQSDLGFSRQENSHDLILRFHHNGYKWTVVFPKSFDREEEATIERTIEDSPNASANTILYQSRNIVKDIQELCRCNECTVEKHKGEMEDESLARLCRIPSVTQHTQSSPERSDNHSEISRKSESQSFEPSTPERTNLDISPSSPSKLEGDRNCSPRRRNRKINRAITDEAKSILEEVRCFVGPDNCRSEPNTYLRGKTFSFYFNHGSLEWVVSFHQNFPQIPAKLYKRENDSRTFCEDVTAVNVVQTVRDFCKCRKCSPSD